VQQALVDVGDLHVVAPKKSLVILLTLSSR
jgi:hypothetical protein